MPRTQLICGVATLMLCAGLVAPLQAGFIAISDPTGSYLAATTLMPVVGNEFDSVTSVTDGVNTATFYVAPNLSPSALTIYDVGSGWATWSSPPDSETATPRVLGTTLELEILLTLPAFVFGFEAEPNGFGAADITVDFFGAGTLLGSITRPVEGDSGARLFAGFSSDAIDRVVINGADQFGIAQLRYGNDIPATVPEPGSGLLVAAVAGLVLAGRTRLKASLRRGYFRG